MSNCTDPACIACKNGNQAFECIKLHPQNQFHTEPMVDGKGELSLEQCKEITDGWAVMSDPRPLVAARLWREIACLRAEMEAVLEICGEDAVRVREGAGPENLAASLAVTVSRLKIGFHDAVKALADLREAQR